MRYLHTMVRVKNLDEALNFYGKIFGLTEIRRYENEKGRFTLVFLAAPGDIDRARGELSPASSSPTTGIRKIIRAGATSGTSPTKSTTSTVSAST